ncbi:MAG: hypothetical protein F9K17_14110 [Phycisphaerae bacterium]|nr:MAG: hypothetical protein F9K17_14110 [Phycisphaerae bacterium]
MRLFIHYQTGLFVAASCFPCFHAERHAQAVEVPAALKAAEESRSRFLTAQFEREQILIDRDDTRRFSSQYAGEDQIEVLSNPVDGPVSGGVHPESVDELNASDHVRQQA